MNMNICVRFFKFRFEESVSPIFYFGLAFFLNRVTFCQFLYVDFYISKNKKLGLKLQFETYSLYLDLVNINMLKMEY